MIAQPYLRGSWWLLRATLRASGRLGGSVLSGALHESLGASQGLHPRVAAQRAEHSLLVGGAAALTMLASAGLLALASTVHLLTSSTAIAIPLLVMVAVIPGVIVGWSRWLTTATGRRWVQVRELENPGRRGYRWPQGHVKELELR